MNDYWYHRLPLWVYNSTTTCVDYNSLGRMITLHFSTSKYYYYHTLSPGTGLKTSVRLVSMGQQYSLEMPALTTRSLTLVYTSIGQITFTVRESTLCCYWCEISNDVNECIPEGKHHRSCLPHTEQLPFKVHCTDPVQKTLKWACLSLTAPRVLSQLQHCVLPLQLQLCSYF